jgi:hypothetical protein
MLGYGRENVDLEFVRLPSADPRTLSTTPDYMALSEEAIDVVLEVTLLRLTFKGYGKRAYLEMYARARLINARTGEVLSDSTFWSFSESRKLEEWIEDAATPLTEAVERGLQTLAEDIVDDNFLLFYPNKLDESASSEEGEASVKYQLPRRVPHYVLSPVYPPIDFCFPCEGPFSATHHAFVNREFVEVGSVQPMLRWERFPRAHDLIRSDGQQIRISDVRYEVRVFDAATGHHGTALEPARQVYGAREIHETYHQVKSSLNPCTNYFWTVRARFKLGERFRVIEWAGAFTRTGKYHARHPWNTDYPQIFYYTFMTPCD